MRLRPTKSSFIQVVLRMFVVALWSLGTAIVTAPMALAMTPTSIFAPASTPARSIYDLSLFVLAITSTIFVVVAGLLAFIIFRFRERRGGDDAEPAHIYRSVQVELARTVVPLLL